MHSLSRFPTSLLHVSDSRCSFTGSGGVQVDMKLHLMLTKTLKVVFII